MVRVLQQPRGSCRGFVLRAVPAGPARVFGERAPGSGEEWSCASLVDLSRVLAGRSAVEYLLIVGLLAGAMVLLVGSG